MITLQKRAARFGDLALQLQLTVWGGGGTLFWECEWIWPRSPIW